MTIKAPAPTIKSWRDIQSLEVYLYIFIAIQDCLESLL